MKFAAVGDNCIDWYYLQGESYIGGCSLNVSVYLKQLGGDSAYVSAVGNDSNGTLIREGLMERGIDISHLHVLPGKTAVTKIELVDNDRTFRGYDEGVLAGPFITEEDLAFIRSCDYMHTSVYGNCQSVLPKVKKDVVIGYDFAYKLDHETVQEVLQHIHYGFFSYEKDDAFIRSFLKEKWASAGPDLRLLVATLGSEGSLAYDGSFYKHEIEPVKPVDTMGAGDSFIAGFLYGIASGLDYRAAMRAGSEKARETVLVKGAFGPVGHGDRNHGRFTSPES